MGKINVNFELTVKYICPHCEEYNDLFEDDNLTDEGWLHNLLMPENKPWAGACDDFSKDYMLSFGEEYRCPKCKKVVDIGYIQY